MVGDLVFCLTNADGPMLMGGYHQGVVVMRHKLVEHLIQADTRNNHQGIH